MSICAQILGDSPLRLWGLSPHERLLRQLRSVGVETAGADTAAHLLLLRADYVYEIRTLSALLKHPGTVLVCSRDGGRAAAFVAAEDRGAALVLLQDPAAVATGIETITPEQLASFDVKLRRSEAPLLEPLTAETRSACEDQLYGNSYKGITDLVTKWLWPRPAKRIVRACSKLGLKPNGVTFVGFLLMVLASVLFLYGYFWSGLLAGWMMTLLDTVDGKLARVTVQSSRFGHYFDHLIDLFHPLIWYLCWGAFSPGLQYFGGVTEREVCLFIVAGYVAGRVIEGVFHLIAECSIFSWRPFDAWFRLITARRNPCLILLTLPTAAGLPEWGLFAVAVWTVLTTLVLLVRLLQAAVLRVIAGKQLGSWMRERDAPARHALSYRTFSRTLGAYAPG